MTEWTRDMVEDRVEEAADVLRQLPPVRLSGYFSTWPDILRSFGDRVGANPVPMRRPPPNPAAISRMEETITWNRFLERDEVQLMWARAEGTPWKHLCHRFGISRPTAHRRYDYALSVIAWRLNGRQVHHRRGRGSSSRGRGKKGIGRRAHEDRGSPAALPLWSAQAAAVISGQRRIGHELREQNLLFHAARESLTRAARRCQQGGIRHAETDRYTRSR